MNIGDVLEIAQPDHPRDFWMRPTIDGSAASTSLSGDWRASKIRNRLSLFRFEPTASGKFMLNILFSQSKYYVDNLAENIRRGQRQKLKNGIWPLNAPIGYLNDRLSKTIKPDPDKAPLIRKAFELYASGNLTIDQLKTAMDGLGLTNRYAACTMRISSRRHANAEHRGYLCNWQNDRPCVPLLPGIANVDHHCMRATKLKRPKSCTSRELRKTMVTLLDSDLHLQCKTCLATWQPMLRAGGKMPRGYWRCVNGCNR